MSNENLCSKLNKHVLIVINFFNYLHLDVVSIIVHCMIYITTNASFRFNFEISLLVTS